jgi:hypothetical protein
VIHAYRQTDGRRARQTDGQTDRDTDITKLIGAYCDFANAPKEQRIGVHFRRSVTGCTMTDKSLMSVSESK